jgi:hypothetical protein
MPLSPMFLYIFLGILAILLLATILFFLWQKKGGRNKSVFLELHYFSLSNLIIGLALFFFRFEGTMFMTARYWLVLWFLGMGFWLYTIWRKFINLSKKNIKDERLDNYLKYLPKKK